MGTVRVEDEHYPEGEPFEIPGLGLVKNFEDTQVDAGQIATYKAMTGSEWPDSDFLTITSKEPEEPAPVESSPEGPPADESTGGEG
jgi:hypothetical protein